MGHIMYVHVCVQQYINVIKTRVCNAIYYMSTVMIVVSRLYIDYVVVIFCFCGNSATILKAVQVVFLNLR